jgi:pyruvate dehydrogenase E2 component (dihydrolipoamide acetyltransferase)
MAKELKLPELGENIESADVLNVLVKPGDSLEKEQGVIEIETDKATVEVPSSEEGTIKEVLVKAGDKVKVGQAILTFENGESTSDDKQKKSDGKETEKKTEKKSEEKSEEKKEDKKEEKPEQKSEKKSEQKTSEKVSTKSAFKKSGGGMIEVKLPDLGENIESADVLKVLVKEGDTLEVDQSILEIETDKATVEVPSEVSGKVSEVLVKDGDKVKIGQVLLKIESSDSAESEEKKTDEKQEAEVEDEKAEKKESKKEKQEPPKDQEDRTFSGQIDKQPPIRKDAAPAAPSVRRIARELGVKIQDVPGTGPSGRISMDDVKAHVKNLNEGRAGKSSIGIKQEALPDFSKYGEVDTKPMSKIRSVTADHLTYSWGTIPHVTQHDKADITELEKIRKAYNPKVEKAGGKLTMTSILLKISTAALKVFPQFNSSINFEKKEVFYKKYFNIGIAVDTEHGLIVPVIKNVDKKNLTELSVELNSVAEKARIRKISLEELQGGCFTITNLGGIGGTSFTPIVNAPEVAILGVSRGGYEPVYNKETGEFEPRMMLPLSLSYDHRIIDGADAARFLRWVCEALEQPFKIMMEG